MCAVWAGAGGLFITTKGHGFQKVLRRCTCGQSVTISDLESRYRLLTVLSPDLYENGSDRPVAPS